jgi:hypothetical protein
MARLYIYLMIVRTSEWSPKFFHQKGWIGSNFQVKTNCGALRWKKRSHTETHLRVLHCQEGGQPSQSSRPKVHKPTTAPPNVRSRGDIVETLEKVGAASGVWEEAPPLAESKYSNFRTSVSHRKQLLYLKPYTRYQSQSLTIDQKKMEIYREINHPDLSTYSEQLPNKSQMIEYLTEYKDPFESRPPPPQLPSCRKKAPGNRASLHILREKLKRKCEPASSYSKRMHAINF